MKLKLIAILIVLFAIPFFVSAQTTTEIGNGGNLITKTTTNADGKIISKVTETLNSNGQTVTRVTAQYDPATNNRTSQTQENIDPVTNRVASKTETTFDYPQKKMDAVSTQYDPTTGKPSKETEVKSNFDPNNPTATPIVTAIITNKFDPNSDVENKRISEVAETIDPQGNVIDIMTTMFDPSTAEETRLSYKNEWYDPATGKTGVDSYSYAPDGITVSGQTNTVNDPSIKTPVSANNNPSATGDYQAISPIKDPNGTGNVSTTNFPAYLQAMYRIGIGMCFVLGVIMFTWAGIEYIISESIYGKSNARKRIEAALIGLAIALASYIILYTINPNLLTFKNIQTTTSPIAP